MRRPLTATSLVLAALPALLGATQAAPRSVPPADLAQTYAAAVAAHGKRCLADASRGYASVLDADPPRPLTAPERALVLALAPSLRTHATEFFGMDDVAAILHPDRPVIGYHLFWDDDVDFPEDNDPTDHEVIWVEYDPEPRSVRRVVTYFHGTLLEASGARLAFEPDGRPIVGVKASQPVPAMLLAGMAAASEPER